MKKLIFVIPLIVVFAFFGCTKDDSNPSGPGGGGPAAPTNVTIQATTDGLGIVITWNAVAGVDSYEVETPDQNVIVDTGTTTYTHSAPNNVGTYRVRAYDNNTAGTWSSSLSSSPVSGSGQIGEWSASTIHSCYYWDSNGNGYTISRLDANAPTLSDIFLYDNPHPNLHIMGAQNTPLSGNHTTMVAYDASTVSPYAPSGGYYNGLQCNVTGYFWLELANGHYVRLKITVLAGEDVTFSWLYQLVQGFRYVD